MDTPLTSTCSPAVQDAPQWTERPAQSTAMRLLSLASAFGASGTDSAGTPTRAHVVPSKVVAAGRRLAATFAEVMELGRRLAAGIESARAEDRVTWIAAQAELRADVTSLAATVSALPARAPERAAVQTQLARLGGQMAQLELPVLARFDVGLGETWAHFNDTAADSEGAALATSLKCYGLDRNDLHHYVVTGVDSAGLKRALGDAQHKGELPALGVVRAACQLRADYLRASAPGDAAAANEAERLDGIAAHVSEQRAAIHLHWGATTAARLTSRYPDETRRPKRVQQQIDAAMQAIASVRQHAVDRVTAHPERYRKSSALRTLAADALVIEANLAESQARVNLDRAAKALVFATEARNAAAGSTDSNLVAPPPKLHPHLIEGGLIDRRRAEALAVDPRLCDVVTGGERALQYTHAGNATLRLRLMLAEQQVAYLQSRQHPLLPQLVARVTAQRESLFNTTLATHDELVRQKPGTLSLGQTRLLAELDNDVVVLARGIAAADRENGDIERAPRIARENVPSTTAEVAIVAARDAITASGPHMKTIPVRGPERIVRLQAALDHHAAALGARIAANESETVRRKLRGALDSAVARLPEDVQQQSAYVQAYRDSLAMPQAGAIGVFGNLVSGVAVDVFALAARVAGRAALERAEGMMIDELDIDPAKARALLTEVFQAPARPSGSAATVRERMGKLVDARCASFGADARTTLADTLTADVIRRRCTVEAPAHGTAAHTAQAVETYYARLECGLIKEGVQPQRARALVLGEKTAMHNEVLASANGPLAAVVKLPGPAADTPAGATAATRILLDKLTAGARNNDLGKAATPLRAVPLSLRPQAVSARPQQRAASSTR